MENYLDCRYVLKFTFKLCKNDKLLLKIVLIVIVDYKMYYIALNLVAIEHTNYVFRCALIKVFKKLHQLTAFTNRRNFLQN